MIKCLLCRKKKIVLTDCRCDLKQICMSCITNHLCNFDYKINSSNYLEKNYLKLLQLR